MGHGVRTLLVVMVVVGALLTFTLEPLTGRLVTPIFGGSIHVWNVCVMVFQGLFLAAMVYAHGIARRFPRIHVAVVVCGAAFLPVSLTGELSPTAPVAEITRSVLLGVGFPFLVLATTAVVAQSWWADSEWGRAREPYALFAGSNIGSLCALMAYPLVIERSFGVGTQRVLWSAGYVIYAGLVLMAYRSVGSKRVHRATWRPVNARKWPIWLALSALPSALSLGLTNVVASELGSFPLFWVLPLALYLGSFAVAFRDHDSPDGVRRFWPDLVVALLYLGQMALLIEMHVLMYLAFFGLCWISHEALYERRPAPSELTEFYGVMAAGGWLGGVFVTLIAPAVFRGYGEYTVSLLALACVLAATVGLPDLGWWRRVHLRLSGSRAVFFVACFSLYIGLLVLNADKGYVERARNSYGVFNVAERLAESGLLYRELSNSSTSHGKQYVDADKASVPVSYYHPTGSNGMALMLRERPARIAGVGLGTGAAAAYLESDEHLVFYEINPLSERLARRWFTYLENSKGDVEVRIGDARLLLERELDQRPYDVIFVDAFAGDGIPTHLLTREAVEIYANRLADNGLLIIHISNRYYDLRGVLAAVARRWNWSAAVAFGGVVRPQDPLADSSSTVVFSASANRLTPLLEAGWSNLVADPNFVDSVEWTDDYVDMLSPFFAMRSGGDVRP